MVLNLGSYIPEAQAIFNNTTQREDFAGKHNYLVTGGTLRKWPNGTSGNGDDDGNGTKDSCEVISSDTASLPYNIPATATILAAYLYWGGSGTTADNTVTFNGTSVTADDTFSDNFTISGQYDFDYFGGFEDVTSLIPANPNTTYTFSGLTVDTGGGGGQDDYCTPSAVVAGWSLFIFYADDGEDYRYTRIYDGLQYFRGASVTTNQSGFRVPDLLDGKTTVVTWEGDPDAASSGSLAGFTEELTFDGTALPSPTNSCNVADVIYNSKFSSDKSPTFCDTTSYGVDISTFDITSFLTEGKSSASLEYSSGNDLVFLAAQVLSTTNTPVADMGIDKSHTGDFSAGGSGSFSIVVHNYGPEIADGTTTVTDVLPTGLSYASSSGTGWSCSSNAPTLPEEVTCTNTDTSLPIGADLPTLTLNVTVAATASASIDNTASVAHPMFDGTGGNQSDTDTVTILQSDLSTSTKTVSDLDGGDADPGDTLRYTITLTNTGTGAASNVSVTDDVPANVSGFDVVLTPGGSTDSSTAGGANGNGYLNVTGIAVPASSSVTVVFDVTVDAVAPGTTIDNTANVTDPVGPDPALDAATVTVSQSGIPLTGNKILYVYDNQQLTRTVQTANTTTAVVVLGGGGSQDWSMTPVIPAGKSLTLSAGTVTVQLITEATGNNKGNPRPITVELRNNAGKINTDTETQNLDNSNDSNGAPINFNLTVPQTTLSAGDRLILRVINDEEQGGTPRPDRTINISQKTAADGNSTVSFTTSTVINIDSVNDYSAAYPATTTKTLYDGENVYIRAVVSDPFGSADITGATVDITDAGSTLQVNDGVMTQVASDAASKTYEYVYAVAGSATPMGIWSTVVTATEGTEGTVSDTGNGGFGVGVAALGVAKSHTGNFTAGTNGSFSIVVSNNGALTLTQTTTVTDTLDASFSYVSGTGTGWDCTGSSGQNVSCTNATDIPAAGSLPTLTLTVAVAGSAPNSVSNTAAVANPDVNGGVPQNGNTDAVTIDRPDLSTSTKTVADLNGGDAAPGDTLRYTITITESAGIAVSGVSVTDDIPSNVSGFNVVSIPLGSTDGSGADLSVTNISVAANGSASIVFDVTIPSGATAGDNIDNTAVIDNPNGPDASPDARTITVLQSQVPGAGTKILYLYDNQIMTRTEQTSDTLTPVEVAAQGGFEDWQMTPAIPTGKTLTLSAGTINAQLVMSTLNENYNNTRPVVVSLRSSSGQIAASASVNVSGQTPVLYTFSMTLGAPVTLNAGDYLVLRVQNDDGNNNRNVGVHQQDQVLDTSTQKSTLSFDTSTVINVDSVDIYNAVYSAVTTQTYYVHGDSVYVRTVISDPFGSYDVSGAVVDMIDSAGVNRVTDATMTEVADSGAATKTFEYLYIVPADARLGTWTASVEAREGSEGTVTHTGNASFEVRGSVTLSKTWVNATAGDAVSLTIGGGLDAVAGTSIAPSTTTAATAASAATTSITLTEALTTGSAANYTVALACVKDSDASAVAVTGTGLSRSIAMPVDSSVTCTWTNTTTVPLTVVKLSQVVSDPFNGTSNPKAIPGAYVDYIITVMNPSAIAIDLDSVTIADVVPANTDLFVGDIGATGSGPAAFTDGTPPNGSGLTYTYVAIGDAGDDIVFFDNLNPYTPSPDGDGFDSTVTGLQINPKGAFAPNGQFTIRIRVRIE